MADPGDPIRPTVESGFLEVAQTLFALGDLGATLRRIVTLATHAVDGCHWAGIFSLRDDVLLTSAASDPSVLEVDRLQRESGEGPCLDATGNEAVVECEDLATDGRWPTFGPQAVAKGVRSVLAIQLASDAQVFGVLNLYSSFPRAFGAIDRTNALLLAGAARLALSTEHAQDDAEQLRRETAKSVNLEAALVTRTLIGRAEGILMERERVTADQAFDMLRRASQRLNMKVRDVAQRVVDERGSREQQ